MEFNKNIFCNIYSTLLVIFKRGHNQKKITIYKLNLKLVFRLDYVISIMFSDCIQGKTVIGNFLCFISKNFFKKISAKKKLKRKKKKQRKVIKKKPKPKKNIWLKIQNPYRYPKKKYICKLHLSIKRRCNVTKVLSGTIRCVPNLPAWHTTL